MKIRTLLKRGDYHKNNCEDDNLLIDKQNHIIFAVFDGCSKGVKSHFASALYSKILNLSINITQPKIPITSLFNTPDTTYLMVYRILNCFINRLHTILSDLNLYPIEVLSTMILGVINKKTGETTIAISGDGCIMLDGDLIKFDCDNAPDYIAGLNKTSDMILQENIKFVTEFIKKDVSISTDGIFSFMNPERTDVTEKVIDYLLVDKGLIKSESMLSRKCNILYKKDNIINYDDLSIIRIIL